MAILLRTRHLLASSGSWSLHRCLQGRSKCPGVSCGLRHVESGVILAIRSLTFANINLPSHKPTPLPGETAAGGGTATSSGERKMLIWEDYRRNHKGQFAPRKTRKTCRWGSLKKISTASPCPICRDDIKIDYKDRSLLEQFICPHTGEILPAFTTGLCRREQKKLVAAIEKAWDTGYLPYHIPRELPKEKVPDLSELDMNKKKLVHAKVEWRRYRIWNKHPYDK